MELKQSKNKIVNNLTSTVSSIDSSSEFDNVSHSSTLILPKPSENTSTSSVLNDGKSSVPDKIQAMNSLCNSNELLANLKREKIELDRERLQFEREKWELKKKIIEQSIEEKKI